MYFSNTYTTYRDVIIIHSSALKSCMHPFIFDSSYIC